MSSPRKLPPRVEPSLPSGPPADPNAFLAPDEEPVPPEVLNGPLPGQDNRFYNDMYNDSGAAPQEVVDDVLPEVRRAEPAPREVTASTMDLSFINKINDPNLTDEQARAEYNKLPPALRYVYDRTADFSYNNPDTQTPAQLDPRDANRWLDEFYQMQDRMQLQKSDPVRQASAEAKELTNQDAMQKRAGVLDEISQTRNMINEMLEHPGFSGSVGRKNYSYLFGAFEEPIAGTKEADFYPYIKQIRGGAFLKAFERIKGGGQITEIEGEKATDAIIRAQTSQSEEGFRKSMNDFLEVINSVERRMKESGGQGAAATSTAAAAPAAQARNTFVYDGATYERLPDGTARLIE